jgi:hypothetical protein
MFFVWKLNRTFYLGVDNFKIFVYVYFVLRLNAFLYTVLQTNRFRIFTDFPKPSYCCV